MTPDWIVIGLATLGAIQLIALVGLMVIIVTDSACRRDRRRSKRQLKSFDQSEQVE